MFRVNETKNGRRVALALGLVALALAGASCARTGQLPVAGAPPNDVPPALPEALARVKQKFAPDPHLAIFTVTAQRQGDRFVLDGEVDDAAAKKAAEAAVAGAGFRFVDNIVVLPAAALDDKVWGIATLSVSNVREKPGNPSEMGTQILEGNVFRVWKKETNWFLVQSSDRYLGWLDGGDFFRCNREEVNRWLASPRLIVTAFDDRILEQPDPGAAPVADVVMGGLVKRVGETNDWFKVEIADGREGYLPKKSAADYAQWQKTRHPTPANIERTARSFLGRPYFWGCNSIRGMDCSGLTKLVFYLNGISLERNASEQCLEGVEVPLDDDLKNLRKGDLLFFGRRHDHSHPEKVVHVGIYLGDKMFIQASDRVRISSLDSSSPLSDPHRIRTLLHARRILPGD